MDHGGIDNGTTVVHYWFIRCIRGESTGDLDMNRLADRLIAPHCARATKRRTGTQSLIDEITQDALRRAALAPTYMAALDITGAALIAVAAVVRMESRGVAA
jgi:hypothetical protein